MWKIEKLISKGDYYYCLVKNHPNATKNGYVLHHRVVVENHLSRLLNSNEVIHHRNGDKKDNRIENLEIMDKEAHARLHQSEKGRKWVKLKCPSCGVIFDREHNRTLLAKKSRYTCCSNSCRGKFSRYIQLHGTTHKVEEAISVNIVSEFRKYPHDNTEQTV